MGYDEKGKQICTTQINTAGEPSALRLKLIASPNGLNANGHDLALIEVEAIDEKGTRNPIAMSMIHFNLKGAAEWRGGMAQGPDNYILSKDLPLECGVNRVLIRSLAIPGNITIEATSDGLKPATITFNSKPFKADNGVTENLPSKDLPSYLKKGPTPSTPSFKQTRIAIPIIKSISGANTDSTFASYDDNELSDWANDGKLSTAWIEYELEKETTVNEVCLKLNNFRTRNYPLRITVDGKEVFNDTTQRSLGYFTISCNPVKGKKVRIQLMETSKLTKDEGTEVSGKRLDDGVTRSSGDAKGTFSIIEVEIYEAIKQ
jgi:hypothetical protein